MSDSIPSAEAGAAAVVVEAKLAELLGLLTPLARAADRGLVRELVSGPLAARLQVWPASQSPPPNVAPPTPRLTTCEQDCLAVIRAAGRRLTKPQIVVRLRALGKAHGDSTLLRGLARLVRTGLLTNARDHFGYGIP